MADPRVAGLPVNEIEDELVDVRESAVLRFDSLKDTGDGAYAYLRLGLVERLQAAQVLLPDGYQIQLVEGYRPYAMQEQYFTSYRNHLKTVSPKLSGTESYQLASRYVCPPAVAPHVSGAAIDLTLLDGERNPLDMGTEINATPEDSAGGATSRPTTSPGRRITTAA